MERLSWAVNNVVLFLSCLLSLAFWKRYSMHDDFYGVDGSWGENQYWIHLKYYPPTWILRPNHKPNTLEGDTEQQVNQSWLSSNDGGFEGKIKVNFTLIHLFFQYQGLDL